MLIYLIVNQCRLVHKARNQCAFILANCEDHDIGLLSYLRMYYCKLPHVKPIGFFIIAIWLSLLFSTIGIAASDFLCVNLSTIASILGMSESLTGVTFLAFGNGSPDVFSTFAAMSSNSGSLAVGELIGAAGFISAVVAGSMALVRPFRVARRSFVRDIGFFICATSFALVFLADGHLHAWECAAMIAFYGFYVVTVVVWHWYMGRQRRKRERDIAARAHFHIPENQELEIEEAPEDDDPVAGAEQRPLLGATSEDFGALEQGSVPTVRVEPAEEDDEARERYLAELHDNMRVSKASTGPRGSAVGPIRPSLVGALEFRSVLASLEKARSMQSGKINLRSYSDEPNHAGPSAYPESGSSRARAVSAGTSQNQGQETDGPISFFVTEPPGSDQNAYDRGREYEDRSDASLQNQNGFLFASPTSSGFPSRSASPAPSAANTSEAAPNRLAPPAPGFRQPNYQDPHVKSDQELSGVSPRATPRRERRTPSPASSRSTSPPSPFPPYLDDGTSDIPVLRLPRGSLSLESDYTHDQFSDDFLESKAPKWWPNRWIPIPNILLEALLPTLYDWRDKNLWEKALGIVAAPSVFFLTITLPVVEPKEPEPEVVTSPTSPPAQRQRTGRSDRDDGIHPADAMNGGRDMRVVNKPSFSTLNRSRQDSELPVAPPGQESNETNAAPPKHWNRWLLLVHLFTSPFFIALAIWTNLSADLSPRAFILPFLIALSISCVLTAGLLLTTKSTITRLPTRLRPFLAFLGFAVSIAWISSLATEVVSVLKALGVILDISDSLLGLTIFAVGNSLGDLVADVTVARLGYPVMALSACFGGPMLNILIGIGVGGLYMTLHPNKGQHSAASDLVNRAAFSTTQTYKLSISKTLLISGASLLATLVGLLIVVPLNNWRMDRRIGVGLIFLWTVSTICNVVVELVS